MQGCPVIMETDEANDGVFMDGLKWEWKEI